MKKATTVQAGRNHGRYVLSIVVALLILAIPLIGCGQRTPAAPSPAPASPPATEAAPPPSPAPATTSPSQIPPPAAPEPSPVLPPSPETATVPGSTPAAGPEPESKEPATQFIWTVDSGIRLQDAAVPNIVRLEDGRFRLYYGGPGGILSAISQDGLTFTKEAGVRVAAGSAGSAEMVVSDPTLVKLKDGRVRMYYKGATGGGGPGQAAHSIFSAISADGLRFEKEGIRIDSHKTPDGGWASVPEAVLLPDGKVRIYYVSDGADVGHGVVSAISEDGLDFTREGPVLPGFVDPAVIRLAGGEYLILAVAFPMSSKGKLTDAQPGIYSFTSKDGVSFTNRQSVLPGENNIDPAIVEVASGTYRVYYWNVTDKPSVIRSISGKLALPSTRASPAAAPNIVSVLAPRSIPGAGLWLFAVDDGSPQLALSAESDGKLLMGRLAVTDPSATVSWQTVASPGDTEGPPIADHWHIFAHGYHWLVFSVAGDSASYLLKLDKDFKRLAIVPVGHTDGPTNDMFLVAEPDGVAVGQFAPGFGHTVHRFDLEAKKTGQVRIGGGIYTHTNGSSAILLEDGYLLFATESLNPTATSAVRAIRFDSSWRPLSIKPVFDEDGTNAAMATAVRLGSGYTIVHLRVRTGVSPRQKAPSPQPGPLPADDSGALVRLVLAPDGTMVSKKTLVAGGANRAHTTLVGDLLVTTWDETGTVLLRVDRLH